MAKDKDVFGFDELEKSFKNLTKKYPNHADAMLMAQGRAVNKRTKALTPIKTKKLRNSWRLKKVKLYKGGTVRVVRVQSTAPHAHLVENGHEMYTTGGRKGKVAKYNAVERAIRGIKKHKRVEGTHMLEYAIDKAGRRFPLDAQKMLNKLIESEGLDD